MILLNLLIYIRHEIKFQEFYIRYNQKFGWQLSFSENDFYTVKILPTTVITPYLIFLHSKSPARKKQFIPICKDSLTAEEYRKLIVSLKISSS